MCLLPETGMSQTRRARDSIQPTTVPAFEEGVQMESKCRCASRPDAGDPAFDLCKLGGNIRQALLNVHRRYVKKASQLKR